MTIIKTYVKLNQRIRHCNRIIKNAKNEARAYRAEAAYHQAIVDGIKARFHLEDDFKSVEAQNAN